MSHLVYLASCEDVKKRPWLVLAGRTLIDRGFGGSLRVYSCLLPSLIAERNWADVNQVC